jgi:hypothetical protein
LSGSTLIRAERFSKRSYSTAFDEHIALESVVFGVEREHSRAFN